MMKRPKPSALRFCQAATELPYAHLYEYQRLTLAISRVSQFRRFPEDRSSPLTLEGVVHQESGRYDDGSARPLLPAVVEIDAHRSTIGSDHPVTGSCNWHPFGDTPYFQLALHVDDPDGSISGGLVPAFERAVLGGNDFMHISFIRSHEAHEKLKAEQEAEPQTYDQRQAMLAALNKDYPRLPNLAFDEVAFDDACHTKAPTWSWLWHDAGELTARVFQDRGVRLWRAHQLRWSQRGKG